MKTTTKRPAAPAAEEMVTMRVASDQMRRIRRRCEALGDMTISGYIRMVIAADLRRNPAR